MRDVFFRGFHPCAEGACAIVLNGERIKGEWIEGYMYRFSDTQAPFIMQISEGGVAYAVRPETVAECVFSGENTAYPKVFETDIVKVRYIDCGEICEEISVVKFDEKKAAWTPFNWEYSCDGCDCGLSFGSVEVIGNIFENPDLVP